MTEMTRVAFLLYPGVTALDVVGPYEVLHGLENVEVSFVAKEVGPVVADSGVLLLGATRTLAELPQPDVLIVPGSSANTPTAMADGDLIRYIQKAHETSRFTVSVCSGALILAATGVLEDLPATTHWFGMETLGRLGAKPKSNARVVRSGKVITAAGVSAGIDMALTLAAELADVQAAKVEQLWIEYDPQPPYDAGHLSKADPETARRARILAKERAKNPRNLVSLPLILVRRWRQSLSRARRA